MSLYLYGLVEQPLSQELAAGAVCGEGAIRSEPVGSWFGLVSDTAETEILQKRRHMLAHAKALEEAMGLATVLPARFGTVVERLELLEAALRPQSRWVEDAFGRVAGKAEYGVRIAWSREEAMRELVAAHPTLARRFEAIKHKPAAATHFERIEIGREVGALMEAARAEEERRLVEALQGAFSEIRVQPYEEDVQVLKAELLLPVSAEAALFARLEAIEQERPGRLAVRCVGPSPAYNFVRIRLGPELFSAAPAAA